MSANYMFDHRKMWFGVRGHMQWIDAAAADQEFPDVGWGSQLQYLSGQAGVRASVGSHKEYNLLWNTLSRDEARKITDYAQGVYDTTSGVNLIYFIDPMAADKNVAPQFWASPASAASDGTTLVPGEAPVVSITPANTLGYPARSVTYSVNRSSSTLYIPIPTGFTAWVGYHGSVTLSGGVTITPSVGFTMGAPVNATVLPVTTTTRVVDSFDSTVCDGITLGLVSSILAPTSKTTISGIIVQILPTGQAPATGGYISGQGNSGCQFLEKPLMSPRSAALDQVALSATLIETGSGL